MNKTIGYTINHSICLRFHRVSMVWILPIVVLLSLPGLMQAQLTFITNNGAITITNYAGSSTTLTIPSTTNGFPVTSISAGAFPYNTSLISVSIPNSVTNIGLYPFIACPNMTTITVDTQNPTYSSPGGVLYDKNQTIIIEFPSGKGGSYTISNNVTSIAPLAFQDCSKVTSVNISSNVTSIQTYTFAYCFKLTAITVDPQNAAYSSLVGVLFDKNQLMLIQCPGGISGNYAVPNTVTAIADGAFLGSSFLGFTVSIPNGLTSIGKDAFYGCGFGKITIPASVTSIGTNAFYRSSGPPLLWVFFGGNLPLNVAPTIFGNPLMTTVYYLPGTTGWGATFAGSPTRLWNPQAQTGDGGFGVQNNQFGFNITGTANIPIVVQACTNFISPVWQTLQSCTITNGSIYFSDPQWANYPARFYRMSSP